MYDIPHAHHDPDGRVRIHRPALSRRKALGALGVGLAAGALTTVSSSPASAHPEPGPQPVPKPIPGGEDLGDPIGVIHFLLPGPVGSITPVIQLPGAGLDVDPSTMTDYAGYTAFAVVAGEGTGSDGATYPIEMDIRVMDGAYLDADDQKHHGVYAFL